MWLVGAVDKYGRKVDKTNSAKKQLERVYKIEDEEEEEEEEEEVGPGKGNGQDARFQMEASEEEEEEEDAEKSSTSKRKKKSADSEEAGDPESRLEYLTRMARGQVDGDGSSSSDSESEVDEEEEEAEEQEEVIHGDATTRLAVKNFDWSKLKAVDLFVVFSSFAAEGVANVTIYPSLYGLQKMAEEEKFGPSGVFDSDTKKEEDQGHEEEEQEEEVEVSKKQNQGEEEEEEEEGEDEEEDDDDDNDDDPLGIHGNDRKKSIGEGNLT
jgi:hypothetical protein